jgi:hypothetical protein
MAMEYRALSAAVVITGLASGLAVYFRAYCGDKAIKKGLSNPSLRVPGS